MKTILSIKFYDANKVTELSINNASYVPNIGEYINNPERQHKRYIVRLKDCYLSDERSHIIIQCTPMLPTDPALHHFSLTD